MKAANTHRLKDRITKVQEEILFEGNFICFYLNCKEMHRYFHLCHFARSPTFTGL